MIAVDTSIAIAALSPWHDRHADAADTCRDGAAIPAHALLEAYATLTRMPGPLRISGHVAAEALDRAWEAEPSYRRQTSRPEFHASSLALQWWAGAVLTVSSR